MRTCQDYFNFGHVSAFKAPVEICRANPSKPGVIVKYTVSTASLLNQQNLIYFERFFIFHTIVSI